MKKVALGVLVGGRSSEYEISLVSGSSVLRNLDTNKYEVYVLVIDKTGSWFLYSGGYERLENNTWQEDESNVKRAVLTAAGLYLEGEAQPIKLDVVFPVVHGQNAEDGRMQGFLTIIGIPFVGCDTESSAVCMDKEFTNLILAAHGVKVAKEWVARKESAKDAAEVVQNQLGGYPVFVKPARAGSSVGISKVGAEGELEPALNLAFEYDGKVIVQEAILGQEVECAVLEGDDGYPIASIIGEIEPCHEFYDYEAKYSAPSKLYVPARLPDQTVQEIQEMAKKAFLVLGCQGMCRVDFLVRQNGEVILNEANTIPGFTSISMYPKLIEASGMPYSKLLDHLIGLALKQGDRGAI